MRNQFAGIPNPRAPPTPLDQYHINRWQVVERV